VVGATSSEGFLVGLFVRRQSLGVAVVACRSRFQLSALV